MRVLVVQHDHDKPLGRLEEPLRREGLTLDVRLAGSDEIELDGHHGVIALSGFADPVDDTDVVRTTRAVLARALDEDFPVLGICLGAQLLAQAAGAVASRCQPEYGYAPIELLEGAAGDRLLGFAPSPFETFHAHDFMVSLPPGAIGLARTAAALQAFHLAPTAWGLQFHPEPSVEVVEGWVEAHAAFLRSRGADPARVAADARRLDAAATALAQQITSGFAAVVRERTPQSRS